MQCQADRINKTTEQEHVKTGKKKKKHYRIQLNITQLVTNPTSN